MIRSVSFDGTTYNDLPHKFEAGTPHISGGIALGIALDWMNGVGLDTIHAHEHALVQHAHQALQTLPGLRIFGTAPDKVGVVSYTSTRWGTLLKKPSGWEDRPATAAECYTFALTHPAVDVVLTGPDSWEQLEANLKALHAPMDAERITWMKELGARARGHNPIAGYFSEGF